MSRLLSQDEIDSLGERVAAFIATVETIRSLPFEHADTVADAIDSARRRSVWPQGDRAHRVVRSEGPRGSEPRSSPRR